jgi:hypothetical protein
MTDTSSSVGAGRFVVNKPRIRLIAAERSPLKSETFCKDSMLIVVGAIRESPLQNHVVFMVD